MKNPEIFSARRITRVAILLALVIVLQLFAGVIKIGTTPLSFVLVPIVLGALMFGPAVGAFLGLAFGVVVLMGGITGTDAFTAILFKDSPVITSLLCLGKGAAAGAVPGWIYNLLKNKCPKAGVFLASAAAPVVNTGLFIGVSLLLLRGTLTANFVAEGSTVIYFLVIVCAGVNFLVEFAISMVCASALYSVIRVIDRRMSRAKGERK